MPRYNRKTAPKVRDGQVQKKNRHAETPTYWNEVQPTFVIDRERPGPGYQHLLRKRDIEEFIEILPDWDALSSGLDAIVLARGERHLYGWYQRRIVGLCAWQDDLWTHLDKEFYEEHEGLFDRLDVPSERRGDGYLCKFSERTAKAYQLLHVFLHELGHLNDHRSAWAASAGDEERYANLWAFKNEKIVWERYLRNFDL